ncbi:hypothetical protein G6M89_17645 [Natronolimnobius sp. AArcel1]|uniref:hypothetical protein n=1 Tax=Natronolimnobius sp. AArcel1 TaxID=1679093 RepID=UPI0013EC6BBC|nr:hypothetical protein [Natronolimnobius sp. AArcel1]NGM70802.1 hypothetical protein [Natronolimnobius sp. AArcel1]
MEASITAEDENHIGLDVLDNSTYKHDLTLERESGEIVYHQCDAYADKADNRTPEENESNEQARRFAQYYVYCEQGYDTVPPEIHPERINAVRLAVQELSDAAFDDLFGDLEQQLRSYHDDGISRPIPIPSAATGPNSVLYRQHVYLGVDPLETDLAEEAKTLATVHGVDLEAIGDNTGIDEFNTSSVDDWHRFSADLATVARTQDVTVSDELTIADVSSLYTAFVDDRGVEHIGEPDRDPFDREPDTLIELAPIDPGPLEEFRTYLDHYLKCQVRDCFIRMGLHPPTAFCVLGPGRIEAAEQYKTLEMYPDFTDPDNEELLASN